MTRRLLPLFALIVLAAFLGILAMKVPRLDLGLVVLATLLLAAWDLWRGPPA
ncbi:hypothetical protein GQF56_17465 [Rhodobacter sphaeroides]|jgi:hypothetical protein|uniref:Uncharacterized protein n=2 Tax=Cereibacter sphaeroides TaxID=1063 RepID=Q3IWW2_CERS4|nr:hypothetical protein [Cereibacter sphaeroides]ABN78114.1 conserved hypothetical protein [Cereibacter sphaeroides ATCC 17029]EKX58650.1 hypothetical protein D516_4288 [Rhodobacter sp. AKP1]ABA80972.1 hypothetical protein RSP_6179 [Cereibacter sphaeroides 2.4.1]ACM03392.1 Hypothetical Protein RSKD131_3532 [Cereibacter sphaeroides KD131]AXC63268.1 hypothetical protein DQL45_17920 [Cereibacter sphaeroides 2.4.1]